MQAASPRMWRCARNLYTKHAAPKIIAPENNPDADAYVFGYRMVGIAKAYKNMLSGMYFSHDKA